MLFAHYFSSMLRDHNRSIKADQKARLRIRDAHLSKYNKVIAPFVDAKVVL